MNIDKNLLKQLPAPSNKRLAVRVSRQAQKIIRQGHPWLFEGSIEQITEGGQSGDLAVVFDHYRRFMAIGLYDPDSPIRIKVLHQGKPATINEAWFSQKVAAAVKLRQPLIDNVQTTGYRLIYGENDGLPGVILDRYDSTLVLKLYSMAWLAHLKSLLAAIRSGVAGVDRLVLRLARNMEDGSAEFGLHDGLVLAGTVPTDPIQFRENGLRFESDVIGGQKTGFFLDQRDNRRKVRSLAKGKTVLDLFACTGGFSINAAFGGATSVVAVDISRPTLAAAERNWRLNAHLSTIERCTHNFIVGDVFEVVTKLAGAGRRFDIVIVDPPSFTHRQSDVDRALSVYGKLTRLALSVLKPGGMLVAASCSSRVSAEQFFEKVEQVGDRLGRDITLIERTHHPLDHPINIPEGAYLKCLFGTA